ncbi:hypothetical protein MASR2M39_15340 [Ignavibacteriales bacterium]
MGRGILLFTIIITAVTNIYSINDLSVRVPNNPVQKKGYMDDITLVVEPHGAYSEQSMYINYTDRHQFPGSQNVEVIHRFELPDDAIVNDLWLWIGDSVMQAIHLDTWTARAIYDSIVAMKKDPAFLSKKGNQYELHVYPLVSGSIRKIKLNYLVPVNFINNRSLTEIPIKFLKSNNNTLKPLKILFRSKSSIWGEPNVYELPGEVFSYVTDTMGYSYKYLEVADLTPMESFKVGFDLGMTDGKFYKSSRMNENNAFFELGISLKDIFGLDPAVTSRKYIFAFDLSSDFSKNLENGMANLRALLSNSMNVGDQFKLLIAGAGQITEVTSGWTVNTGNVVNQLFDLFQTMPIHDQIKNSFKKRKLVFADMDALYGWTFPGMSDFVTSEAFVRIEHSVGQISSADIVLAYRHGNEDPITQSTMLMVADSLQRLFSRGGSFLTYYDFNRDPRDLLTKHFIPGIRTAVRQTTNTTLRRVTSGNIGWRYPVEFERAGQYYLAWTPDPTVKADIIEGATERVTTLSRKIQKGYYIVTGMWPFNDDGAFRKMVHPAFMGLNVSATPPMADTLLQFVKNLHNIDPYQKLIFVSNSDIVYDSTLAYQKAEALASMFNSPKPALGSINLINGELVDPPVVVFDLKSFYGSGGFFHALANKMGGIHFERSIRDWDYIFENIASFQYAAVDSLGIEVFADNGSSPVYEVRRLKSSPDNKYMPQFFAGRHNASNILGVNLTVKFAGNDTISTRSFNFTVDNDTMRRDFTVPGILATEKINELLAYASYDTAQIVSLSLDNRVLSNYTSMLCLEPNDTIHFMTNPWDETLLTGVEDENGFLDTLFIDIYPNPFNSMSLIRLNIPEESRLELNIFDITGQLVRTIANEDGVTGLRQFNWDGTDNFNTTLASGVYLVHVKIRSSSTGKVEYLSKKVIYLR